MSRHGDRPTRPKSRKDEKFTEYKCGRMHCSVCGGEDEAKPRVSPLAAFAGFLVVLTPVLLLLGVWTPLHLQFFASAFVVFFVAVFLVYMVDNDSEGEDT